MLNIILCIYTSHFSFCLSLYLLTHLASLNATDDNGESDSDLLISWVQGFIPALYTRSDREVEKHQELGNNWKMSGVILCK